MKLTTYDREAFVRAVMNDTPEKPYVQLKEEIQAALVKAMSPECRKVFRKSAKALRTEYFGDLHFREGGARFVVGDAEYRDVLKPFQDVYQLRLETKNQLAAVIRGCTTLKQAKDRLPEFTKYLPTERGASGIANLPAITNVVADLVKLGWPKKEPA